MYRWQDDFRTASNVLNDVVARVYGIKMDFNRHIDRRFVATTRFNQLGIDGKVRQVKLEVRNACARRR